MSLKHGRRLPPRPSIWRLRSVTTQHDRYRPSPTDESMHARPYRTSARSTNSLRSGRHRAHLDGALIAPIHLVPENVREERIDVLRRSGAVVHLVGVLVHVHHQERHSIGGVLRVVARPAGAQVCGVHVELEDHPAAAAAKTRTGRTELLLPGSKATPL